VRLVLQWASNQLCYPLAISSVQVQNRRTPLPCYHTFQAGCVLKRIKLVGSLAVVTGRACNQSASTSQPSSTPHLSFADALYASCCNKRGGACWWGYAPLC
jgi:hypothetical protein